MFPALAAYFLIGFVYAFAVWVATPPDFRRDKTDYLWLVGAWPAIMGIILAEARWEIFRPLKDSPKLFIKVFSAIMALVVVIVYILT